MGRGVFLLAVIAACGDSGGGAGVDGDGSVIDTPRPPHKNETVTRVEMTFAHATGFAVTAAFDAGGASEPIALTASEPYELTVAFFDGADDITAEIRTEGAEHQVFFTGSAVVGPATTNATGPMQQDYADTDVLGFPIGLKSYTLASPGTGDLVVTLRHLPPEEPPRKAIDSAAQVAQGGIDVLGGSTDVEATFAVTVP